MQMLGLMQAGMGIMQLLMLHKAMAGPQQQQGGNVGAGAGAGGAQESSQMSPMAQYHQAGNNYFNTLSKIDKNSPEGKELDQIGAGVRADSATAKQNGQQFDAVGAMRDRSFTWAMNKGKQDPNNDTAYSVAQSAQQFKLAQLRFMQSQGAGQAQ